MEMNMQFKWQWDRGTNLYDLKIVYRYGDRNRNLEELPAED